MVFSVANYSQSPDLSFLCSIIKWQDRGAVHCLCLLHILTFTHTSDFALHSTLFFPFQTTLLVFNRVIASANSFTLLRRHSGGKWLLCAVHYSLFSLLFLCFIPLKRWRMKRIRLPLKEEWPHPSFESFLIMRLAGGIGRILPFNKASFHQHGYK